MAQNCIAPVAGSMNQITGRNALIGADPVTAVVHDADGGRRLTVVDDATCTVVLDRSL